MLTTKQEKFVEELIKGKSQREAYKAAYNTSRLKNASIDSLACRLLKGAKVRSRFEELKSQADDKTGDDATSMRAFIASQLKEIAAGKAPDTTIDYDADGDVMRQRTQLKQSDRVAAMDKLAELYGIDETQNDNNININIGAELSKYAD